MAFLAAPVIDVIPVPMIAGNVTVAFAALSYAGRLVVTVVADPERCPDLPTVAYALQRELDLLTGAQPPAADAVAPWSCSTASPKDRSFERDEMNLSTPPNLRGLTIKHY